MILHNDRELFEKIVIDTSEKYNIAAVIVEKDYYVTFFLRELAKRQPKIIFKGGTSLSKCYHLINRFSEDIDLNIESEERPTEGQRKKLVNSVKEIISEYGFKLKNHEKIRSGRDFNRFEIDVNSSFSSNYIKHDLIVEAAVFLRSYPNVIMQTSSYIFDYLKSIGRSDIIQQYCLEPFELNVQSLERTFVDKLFALADYYLDGRMFEHSRHLYDIYKIYPHIKVCDDLKQLFVKVREERRHHKFCLSAQKGIDLKKCLQEIIDLDVYKEDYQSITASLIFDNITYEQVKSNIQDVINSDLFN